MYTDRCARVFCYQVLKYVETRAFRHLLVISDMKLLQGSVNCDPVPIHVSTFPTRLYSYVRWSPLKEKGQWHLQFPSLNEHLSPLRVSW